LTAQVVFPTPPFWFMNAMACSEALLSATSASVCAGMS
jgi:hypothetical protein